MKNLKNKLLCIGILLLFVISFGCTEKEQNETNTPAPETTNPPETTAAPDNPPVAKFSMFPEYPRDTQKITFKNESTEPDDDPLRFEWYVDEEYNCACFSISEKLSKGEHTVKIVAKDINGNENEYELKFYVSETFIEEDVSELVLRREEVGMWNLVTDEYLGENSYHTVLENGENRIECTVEKYDTVEDAENKFKEYFVRAFPYPAIGNETTYDMENDVIHVTFRYGNLICKISINTNLEDAILYSKIWGAKLNQVG